MTRKLIVLSADALVFEDVERLREMPNYRKYLEGGCRIKKVRSIYPTITYPCHRTMVTGVYPDKHQILNNYRFLPGEADPPWHWFYKDSAWREDLFTAAKRAGLTTASLYWPVTGGHPDVDWLMAEYWPQPGDTDFAEIFRRTGSSEEMLEIIREQQGDCVLRQHPSADWFIFRCACQVVRRFQPDLMMVHFGNIDHHRHRSGTFSERVQTAVEETDRMLGMLMEAVEEAGLLERTNLVLCSDHGHIDVRRVIHPNVLLAEEGLLTLDAGGQLKDWKALFHAGGSSGLVYLRDPEDRETCRRVRALLEEWTARGIYGISRFWTEPEIRTAEHMGGSFAFAVETDGYTAFGNSLLPPLAVHYDIFDRRATHGHLPDLGIQPVFSAKGPGFRSGAVLETGRLVDEAPTYAALLGLELQGADGHAMTELLI